MEVGDDAVVVGLVAALVAEPKNHKKKKITLFSPFKIRTTFHFRDAFLNVSIYTCNFCCLVCGGHMYGSLTISKTSILSSFL